jgi:hypothetical protein
VVGGKDAPKQCLLNSLKFGKAIKPFLGQLFDSSFSDKVDWEPSLFFYSIVLPMPGGIRQH